MMNRIENRFRKPFIGAEIGLPLMMKTYLLSLLGILSMVSAASAEPPAVKREFINPENLYQSKYYTQAIATTGGRTVYVSGQWAYDAEAKLQGEGDLAAQALVACRNLKAVLEASKAKPEDVVKVNIYVVNYTPFSLPAVDAGLNECFGPSRKFTSTLVGVQSLAREGMLFEIEAVAVTE